jgi:hypothetical protein
MKHARLLVHALDLDQVALSADDAGLYEPRDDKKPDRERRPLRELDPEQERRYVRILKYERHPDGTLIVECWGDRAMAWMQQLADLDAAAQRDRKAATWARKRDEERARALAALEAAARAEAPGAPDPALEKAQQFAASLGADPTPGAVSVSLTPPMGGQLVDVDLEDIEPPTPPASPASKKKRGR